MGLTVNEDQAAKRWDAFISHAHEDKADFVADLARELTERGLSIWYDDDVLEIGDSVRKAIDQGLRAPDVRDDRGGLQSMPRPESTMRKIREVLRLALAGCEPGARSATIPPLPHAGSGSPTPRRQTSAAA